MSTTRRRAGAARKAPRIPGLRADGSPDMRFAHMRTPPRQDGHTYSADGWESDLLGINTEDHDKARSFSFYPLTPMSAEEGMELYHGDDLAARACYALPDNAMRQGFAVAFPGEKDGEDLSAYIDDECKRLGARESIVDYDTFGRACGGAGLHMGTDDAAPEKPLRAQAVRNVHFLNGYDRRELEVASTQADQLRPSFGRPTTFRLLPAAVMWGSMQRAEAKRLRSTMPVVDESRMLMFGGARTARRERQLNGGWDHSILDKIKPALQQANATWLAIGHLTLDASQSVWAIKGLRQLIAQGKENTLKARMRIVERGRSITRAIIIDADNETFQRVPSQFAGLVEIAREAWVRLAAALDMPVTVLMGVSPAGLNATGESDIKLWYDRVEAHRKHVLEPAIRKLVDVLLAARGRFGVKYQITWPSLWLTSPQEEETRRGQVASRDAQYITAQVVTPEEVALSRFGEKGWSGETQIDLESRRAIAEAKRKRAVETALNPPEVVAAKKAEEEKAAAAAQAAEDEAARKAEDDAIRAEAQQFMSDVAAKRAAQSRDSLDGSPRDPGGQYSLHAPPGAAGTKAEWEAWTPTWVKVSSARFTMQTPAGEARLVRDAGGWQLHYRGRVVPLGSSTTYAKAESVLTRLLPTAFERADAFCIVCDSGTDGTLEE